MFAAAASLRKICVDHRAPWRRRTGGRVDLHSTARRQRRGARRLERARSVLPPSARRSSRMRRAARRRTSPRRSRFRDALLSRLLLLLLRAAWRHLCCSHVQRYALVPRATCARVPASNQLLSVYFPVSSMSCNRPRMSCFQQFRPPHALIHTPGLGWLSSN